MTRRRHQKLQYAESLALVSQPSKIVLSGLISLCTDNMLRHIDKLWTAFASSARNNPQ